MAPSKYYFFLILIAGAVINCRSQEEDNPSYYNSFDRAVGIENTNLYQGVVHKVTYRTQRNSTQFYKNFDFTKGAVFYSGQWFYDINLKYDIYENQLLLKLNTNAGGETLKLLNSQIEAFKIYGDTFINIGKKEAPMLDDYGFYKTSYESPLLGLTLFTQLVKKQLEKKDSKTLYYQFVDGSNNYILYKDGKYFPFNTKSDALLLFPKFKNDINKYYAQVRRLRKSDPDGFQISLIKRIGALVSEIKNKSL